ncbi:hypothetical protein BME99_13700 [Pseudomonas protegens]|nr:hypothetical protein BME99_13700 [Pseudomonas protegens]
MDELGIGLIGTGFMGRAHALAFRSAGAVFELPVRPAPGGPGRRRRPARRTLRRRLGLPRPTATGKT